jgi:hypothetical protein
MKKKISGEIFFPGEKKIQVKFFSGEKKIQVKFFSSGETKNCSSIFYYQTHRSLSFYLAPKWSNRKL